MDAAMRRSWLSVHNSCCVTRSSSPPCFRLIFRFESRRVTSSSRSASKRGTQDMKIIREVIDGPRKLEISHHRSFLSHDKGESRRLAPVWVEARCAHEYCRGYAHRIK